MTGDGGQDHQDTGVADHRHEAADADGPQDPPLVSAALGYSLSRPEIPQAPNLPADRWDAGKGDEGKAEGQDQQPRECHNAGSFMNRPASNCGSDPTL